MKRIRFTNVDGQKVVARIAITDLRAWLKTSAQREFRCCHGRRFTTEPARIVAVDRFCIRVGSARFERIWTR